MRKSLFLCFLLLLLLRACVACAGSTAGFTPAEPRVGDVVDLTVLPDREGAQGVIYRLFLDGKILYESKKTDPHLSVSFRPREEGEYVLEAAVRWSRTDEETVSVRIPVAGAAPEQQGPDVVYSQMDGWWRQKTYASAYKRTLESSGCAIFALSHALQRLGLTDAEALPDRLAARYERYYIEGVGTGTEALVTQAGLHFGYQTVHRLVRSEEEILSFLDRGDLFLLGTVSGHVALADCADSAAGKVRIVDSAPDVTFSKLRGTPVWIRTEDGGWQQVQSAEELPGSRWFFETGHTGGGEYWLDVKDCAARGLRLIRRPWLTLKSADTEQTVSADWFGTVKSAVVTAEGARTVNTAELSWLCAGEDGPRLAVVVREKGAAFTHRSGEAIRKYLPIPWGRVLCVLWAEPERLYVYWHGTFGYIRREDAVLTGISADAPPSAVVSAPRGGSVRGYREPREKSASAAEWPSGTEVVLLERQEGFLLAEGLGCRGWVPEAFLQSVGDP